MKLIKKRWQPKTVLCVDTLAKSWKEMVLTRNLSAQFGLLLTDSFPDFMLSTNGWLLHVSIIHTTFHTQLWNILHRKKARHSFTQHQYLCQCPNETYWENNCFYGPRWIRIKLFVNEGSRRKFTWNERTSATLLLRCLDQLQIMQHQGHRMDANLSHLAHASSNWKPTCCWDLQQVQGEQNIHI